MLNVDRRGVGFRALFVQMGDLTHRTALRYNITCAAFTSPALGGQARFKLNVVKAHTRLGVPGDFSVRYIAADTDNHGVTRVRRWSYLNGSCEAYCIVNANRSY